LRGDSTIYEVGTALKAFLSATGFSAELIEEILEVQE
jgi:hypothetical protein